MTAVSPNQQASTDALSDVGEYKNLHQVNVNRWQEDKLTPAVDVVAEEVAIALVYNGISHVVMMASPNHLEDFALGFSLTEGVLTHKRELQDIEVVVQPNGIELQLTISAERMAMLKQQRRNMTGRTGCGLCGAESLAQAIRPVDALSNVTLVSDMAIHQAVNTLEQHQPLQAQTGAYHGAAWCDLEGNIQLVREDVGRHNALDKLIGALQSKDVNFSKGFVLISSRASYEMVQKVLSMKIGTLASVSAPTALAIRMAKESNLQLTGFVRAKRHVNYTP